MRTRPPETLIIGAYNLIGEMTSSVSAQGTVSGGSPSSYTTTYSYNALGETTGVTNPLGATTSYTYDADGNLISTTNASSQTTTYSYDANSQLVQTVEPGSITISYGYDPAGSAISVGMMSGYVQNTGSSVYKPLRNNLEWRLPRSQLGPGSEPCNNPTRVVAKRVARLVRLVDRPLKEAAVKAREARVESQLSRRVFDRPRCRL